MRKRLALFSVLFLCMLLVSSGAWAVRGYPGNFIHKGVSGHDVTGYGAKGNGAANDSAAFTAAIAAGAGNRVIVPWAASNYKLSTNVTIPAGVTLSFQQGGLLSIDGGVTLTINGKIEAGIGQIFSGAGTAAFAKGSCDEVYPEWWGAIGDNSTDCTAAFNAAMIAGQTVGVVKVSTGTYIISAPLRQWPVATFSTMQGGMILKGNGTFSELRYTGSADYCIEVIDPAGSSSPVAATIEDIHMSAPNIADPDDGGCIGIGASITSINRVTIDDANTATGVFCGLGSGQSIQTIMNDCGFYGSSSIGRAVWMDGVTPILYINNSFFGCKDGILADNDAHITANGLYIFATGTPIWMDDSNLFMSNSWIEGGDTDCFFGGPRSFYRITNTVIGATLFDYESGVELELDNNQRVLINAEDAASVVPSWAIFKIFPGVLQNVWEDSGINVNIGVDADALNGNAVEINIINKYTGIVIRPGGAGEYYNSLPRGTYRWTVWMKDSNQIADDCAVYTRLYDGAWNDTLHPRITLTSDYRPYTFLMVMDSSTVSGTRFQGAGLRVWRLSGGTNTLSISHAILQYLGPDKPGQGDLVAYNPEPSDANPSRESSVLFYGIQSGLESSPLAQILVDHNAAADNAQGRLRIKINDGDDPAGGLGTELNIDENRATFTGDVTINGDDLKMATNTDTFLLVADGTEYSPVEMTGDVGITNAGVTAVGDDSHAHTTTTISGIDISADTNLAVAAPITLTDDTIGISDTPQFTSLALGAPTSNAGTFSGFTGAETKTVNLTGLSGNNPVVRRVNLWVSNDPTADENIVCRLSFYNSDSMTEDELLKDFFFNLTYTETNGGASGSDTTDTVDDIGGLVKYDLIRYMGGTAENVRLTATPTGTTLTFTALANAHADDTGIVKVVEFSDLFQLVDSDASNEIHCKLETLSAPTASMNVAISVDIQ